MLFVIQVLMIVLLSITNPYFSYHITLITTVSADITCDVEIYCLCWLAFHSFIMLVKFFNYIRVIEALASSSFIGRVKVSRPTEIDYHLLTVFLVYDIAYFP